MGEWRTRGGARISLTGGQAPQRGQELHEPTKEMSCQKDDKRKIVGAPSAPKKSDFLAKFENLGCY